jgi:hypothetical protein
MPLSLFLDFSVKLSSFVTIKFNIKYKCQFQFIEFHPDGWLGEHLTHKQQISVPPAPKGNNKQ